MTVTLNKIREKYPNANYSPDSKCQRCNGEGEWYDEREGQFFRAAMRPCICIFVEHNFAPKAAAMLSELARSELKKMDKAQ